VLTPDPETLLDTLEARYRAGEPMWHSAAPRHLQLTAARIFGSWGAAILRLEARVGESIPSDARVFRDPTRRPWQRRTVGNEFHDLRRDKRLPLRAAAVLFGVGIKTLYKWELHGEPPPPEVLEKLRALERQDVAKAEVNGTDRAQGAARLAEAIGRSKVSVQALADALDVSRQRLYQLKNSCPDDRAAEIVALWQKKRLLK
jgi:DNA-binding transcriptional regulator YiaG